MVNEDGSPKNTKHMINLMKIVVAVLVFNTLLLSNESRECNQATDEATSIHWQYVEGNATITESYNAREKMVKICGLTFN
jgi:hypothetical protein